MSSLTSLLFCPLLLSILFLLARLKRSSAEKLNLPPSPPGLPILGNFHQLGTHPHRSLSALSRRYGPIMLLHLGHVPTVVVSSVEMAIEVCKTQDVVFASKPASTAAKRLLYGCTDMAFAPYGDYWREVRKICVTHLLSIQRVQSFKFLREEEAAAMIENIYRSCQLGASVNITHLLSIFTHNLVCRVAFNRKYEGEDEGGRLRHITREVMALLGTSSVGDFLPLLGWIDRFSGLDGRIKSTFEEFDKFLDQVIQDHLIKKGGDGQENQEDLVDILLQVQKDPTLNIPLNQSNVKAIILDMFVGGSDTIAVCAEWVMVELTRNPNILRKVQEEVRKVVGKKCKVEEEDIHQMDCLICSIKEVLRLHPPSPLLAPRESTAASSIKGYHIPAKTRVVVNAWAIQRDPKLWDSPEEFIPDRFTNNPLDFRGRDLQFLPFGAGRRSCPGISFGLAACELILANLLYWFDWELPEGANYADLDTTESFGLTVHMKNPLHLVPKVHFS